MRGAAVKVLNEVVAHTTRVLERFAREIEVLRRLSHPNIVEIYEVDKLDDHRPSMRWSASRARRSTPSSRRETRLALRDALGLMEPVCAALGSCACSGDHPPGCQGE
ncbi:hypothetical protein WMF31_12075 [Sorangium sp. So ce1036]|uniref:hypothetical protein n=1 Tax=Sorangium sp. So ce1036 TaxID=3133328 RepID=UPI003F047BF6